MCVFYSELFILHMLLTGSLVLFPTWKSETAEMKLLAADWISAVEQSVTQMEIWQRSLTWEWRRLLMNLTLDLRQKKQNKTQQP